MFGEVINTLLILGAAQGLFLAVVLLTKHTNVVANRLLAVVMLAFSLYIHQGVYYAREWYLAFPHLIEISQPLIYVFGPVLYLYTRAVSEGGHTFRKAWLLHLLPAALVALYLMPLYLSDGAAKIAFLRTLMNEGRPADLGLIEFLQYPQGILYAILSIGVLRRHRARLRETHSWVERINLLWLRNLTIGIVGAWAVATTLYALQIAGFRIGEMEPMLTRLAVSVLVYGVGYFGLRQPEIFHPPVRRRTPEPFALPQIHADVAPVESAEVLPVETTAKPQISALESPTDEGTGYEKSGLTEVQAQAYQKRLLRLMDETKPYSNSYLTLQELADELSISTHNLSQVINTQLRMNFYDFINRYRVEE
jgi:hypothetical protein